VPWQLPTSNRPPPSLTCLVCTHLKIEPATDPFGPTLERTSNHPPWSLGRVQISEFSVPLQKCFDMMPELLADRLCTHEFFGRRRRRRQVCSVDSIISPSTEQRRRRRRVRSFASPRRRTAPSADNSVGLFQCHFLRFEFNAVDHVCTTLISRQFSMSPSTESSSTDARRKFMCAHPMRLQSWEQQPEYRT
jgi:hypothetical protein